MKILKISLAVVLVLAVVVLIAAPIGPMPGVFIGGTSTAAPAQWPDTSSTHEILLRVPGTLPRVVVVWVVEQQGDLHVVGGKGSGWVTMLDQGGPVDMRLGDNTYALNAVMLSEDWQPVLTSYLDKYRPDYPDIVAGFPTLDQAHDQIAVYRLNRT